MKNASGIPEMHCGHEGCMEETRGGYLLPEGANSGVGLLGHIEDVTGQQGA